MSQDDHSSRVHPLTIRRSNKHGGVAERARRSQSGRHPQHPGTGVNPPGAHHCVPSRHPAPRPLVMRFSARRVSRTGCRHGVTPSLPPCALSAFCSTANPLRLPAPCAIPSRTCWALSSRRTYGAQRDRRRLARFNDAVSTF